jgi:SNF2 family DNA or RNA helicase
MVVPVSIQQRSSNLFEIHFPYDEATIQKMRLCLSVKWNKARRTWESNGLNSILEFRRFGVPFHAADDKTAYAIERMDRQILQLAQAVQSTGEGMYGFQTAGIEYLTIAQRAVIGDSMGLGKTRQVLCAVQNLSPKNVLWVTEKSLLWKTLSQVKLWMGEETDAVIAPQTKRERQAYVQNPAWMTITTYDQIRSRDFTGPYDAVVFDEATRVKNTQTSSAKLLKRLTDQARVVFAITGTPLEIRVEEYFGIFNLVREDVLGHDAWKFRGQHVETDNFTGAVVGAKNIRLLRDRTGPYLIRREKADVLHMLPPKVEDEVKFALTPEEYAQYETLTKQELERLLGQPVQNQLVVLLRAQQFVAAPQIINSKWGMGSKFEALKDVLEDHNGRALVFAQWTEVTDRLVKELDINPLAYIHGDVPGEERFRRNEMFNRGELGNVMVGTDAMAKGLDFSADLVIHYTQLWNPAKMEQREDRCYGIGRGIEGRSTVAVTLVAEATIDEAMAEILRRRELLFDEVVNGTADILRRAKLPALERVLKGHFG